MSTTIDSQQTIMIGSPVMDGWFCRQYTLALADFSRHYPGAIAYGISTDSMLIRGRSAILQAAVQYPEKIDQLIWIDADMEWTPEQLFDLLKREEDFVGYPYLKKKDKEEYVLVLKDGAIGHNGLLEVESMGFGMVKMTRKCFTALYENAKPFFTSLYDKGGVNHEKRVECRLTFNHDIDANGQLITEDTWACRNWQKLGGKCFIDFRHTVAHLGEKVYHGDISKCLEPVPEGPKKEPCWPEDYKLHPDHCRDVLEGCYDVPFNPETPPVILDIGANVGAFTRWAAKRWPGAKIHAYEPQPNNYKLLVETAQGLENVVTSPRAIADRDCKMFLANGGVNCGEFSLLPEKPQGDKNQYGTPWQTTDVDVIDAAKLPKADILKIDTEGAEMVILRTLAAAGRLKEFSAIMLEYHAGAWAQQIVDLLATYGFKEIGHKVHSTHRGELKFLKHNLLTSEGVGRKTANAPL